MADLEEQFLSCLLYTGDMLPVVEARISADYFQDEQHRRVFEFIQSHHRNHGEVPLAQMVRNNWPTYKIYKVDHGIGYFVSEIRNQFLQEQLTLSLADMQDALEDRKPQRALEILQLSLGDLVSINSTMSDVDLTETYEERLTEYEEFRENKGQLRGVTTGFPTLDKATLGYQAEQFIVLVGLPKSGKSTLLMASAQAVHAAGKRVLFVGFEMSSQEQSARYDAMAAHVDHLRLLSGEIGTLDIKKLEQAGEERAEWAEFIVSTDIMSATTVSGIGAKIDQYEPDVTFVDGLYLMDDEYGEPKGSSQAQTNISRGMKRLAQMKKCPIIGTVQALHSKVSRTSGLTLASIGYSSAWGQDANLVVGVESVEEEDGIQRLKSLANRIGPTVEFEVEWDWSKGIFRETDEEETTDA